MIEMIGAVWKSPGHNEAVCFFSVGNRLVPFTEWPL